MKKVILLIGVILCVAVIGSVLAVAVYDANDIEGSISTDTYLYLSLDSSASSGVTLEKGVQKIVPIVMSIDQNDANWGTATLTITPSAVSGKSIEKVTIGIYSDETCKTVLAGANVDDNGVITYAGVTTGKTVYVSLLLAEDASEEEVTNTSGNLTCSFARVAG